MKYLRPFEESKDEYYIKIGYNDSPFKYLKDISINISKQNIDYISKLFKIDIYDILVMNSSVYDINYLNLRSIKNKTNIMIYELVDEYFLVCFEFNLSKGLTPNPFRFDAERNKGKNGSYKCDQIDGVKELLIDNGII